MRALIIFSLLVFICGCGKEAEYNGKTVTQWRRALADPDAAVRREAAFALGEIGAKAKAAVPDLMIALHDSDVEVRINATHALWSMGSVAGPAVGELIAVLADTDAEVRLGAVGVLGSLGSIGSDADAAVPALGQALVHDPDPHVRHAIAKAFQQFGCSLKEVVPALAQALKDGNENVRMAAAYTLAGIGPDAVEAIPALTELLSREQDGEVRGAARNALGKIKAKR